MSEMAVLEIFFFFFSFLIILLLLVGICLLLVTTIKKSKHTYSSKDVYNFNWISREEFEKYKEDQEKQHEEIKHKVEKMCSRHEHRQHKHEHDHESEHMHDHESEQTQ